jgi:hypothetical protein
VVAVAVAVDDCGPRLVVGVIADALAAALAVAADPVVLSSFLLADNAQVLAPAVQPVAVEEYNLLTGAGLQEVAVQVEEPVLALHLDVPDGVALAAVAFGPVTPSEVGKQRIIVVVNQD